MQPHVFEGASNRPAAEADLTLIARARGKRFIALAGTQCIQFDADVASVGEEDRKHARKASVDEVAD